MSFQSIICVKCSTSANQINNLFSNFRIKFSTLTYLKQISSSYDKSIFIHPNMKKYFENYGLMHLVPKIPSYYFKKTENPKSFLLINPATARKISSALKSHVKGRYILESDPGFGFVSNEIISHTSNLRLYESEELFRLELENLKQKHKTNVKIFNTSLLHLGKLITLENYDERISKLFEDIPKSSWSNDVILSFAISIATTKFIYFLVNDYILSTDLKKFGRSEFFFFISPHVYKILVENPRNESSSDYGALPVLFQNLFEVEEILNDLPRKSFLPWPNVSKKKNSEDLDSLYLIKATVKADIYEKFNSPSELKSFWIFVKNNVRPNRRIIPILESSLPNCGYRLILEDYSIYTKFTDLSPQQLLELFLKISKWPDFKEIIFAAFAPKVLPGCISETRKNVKEKTNFEFFVINENDNEDSYLFENEDEIK